MRYKVRQRVFSLGDNFTIKDEFDQDHYIVRGQILSLGNRLRLEDMAGNEQAYIEQQIFRFLPEYLIYTDGRVSAKVKKEFTFFKPKFDIDSIHGNYEIEGNFLGYDFEIRKDGKTVAVVDKKLLSFTDTYEVEISDSEDQSFMLALVIVIDQVIHDNNR